MIPRTADWKNALANAVRDPGELFALLDLPRALLDDARAATERFPLLVPRGYLARMQRGNPNDPLLRQVLPWVDELHPQPGFSRDPVGDKTASAAPGLIHKYQGRILLVTTGACAIHCRYCFRRHFPYAKENPAKGRWENALNHIRRDSSIREVILSGGDPLVLDNGRLADLLNGLNGIRHVERLRIHSRLPVVLPERIDQGLLDTLADTRLQSLIVIHANHANEFDPTVAEALRLLGQQGVTLLNQTVLLAGINDTLESQVALNETLFRHGVLPYYLHLLDRVEGAAHFDTGDSKAMALMAQLRQCLPGYLVPRLVREISGEPNKVVIG